MPISMPGARLLDRDALGEVPGLVDVAAPQLGDVVREQLQRHGVTTTGANSSGVRGHHQHVIGVPGSAISSSPSVATAITRAPRARTSWMFDSIFG